MTDRPILFSGPMVRALLDGSKTQTRRVLNPQPEEGFIHAEVGEHRFTLQPAMLFGGPTWKMLQRLPRPGDRLYVREAWRTEERNDFIRPRDLRVGAAVYYEAGGGGEEAIPECAGKLRPGMFMLRWASRLTLIVTDVRVERLQDISDADAIAEGIVKVGRFFGLPDGDWDDAGMSAVHAYAILWDSINGKRPGCAWSDNPWVVAVSFTVHQANIDAIPAREAA